MLSLRRASSAAAWHQLIAPSRSIPLTATQQQQHPHAPTHYPACVRCMSSKHIADAPWSSADLPRETAESSAAVAAASATAAAPTSAAVDAAASNTGTAPWSRGQTTDIVSFLSGPSEAPIFDVRAPIEYAGGHIPGALSLPIFPDEQRAAIGTTYRKASKAKAVLQGLDLFGPRMSELLVQAQRIVAQTKEANPEGRVRLHCARGGMRSQAMQWLLELGGLKVTLLKGGYKAYRHWVFARHARPMRRPLIILGGLTGSGKTRVLEAMARQTTGQQRLQYPQQAVLDLEALASHKGSSFGAIGLPPQPTRETFENELARTMQQLDDEAAAVAASAADALQLHPSSPYATSALAPVWVEDESRMIGSLPIPDALYTQMRLAPMVVLEVPFEVRVEQLAEEYCRHEPRLLHEAIQRIERKLGLERARRAHDAIDRGDMAEMVRIALQYYDQAYQYGVQQREARVHTLHVKTDRGDAEHNAALILDALRTQQWRQPTPVDEAEATQQAARKAAAMAARESEKQQAAAAATT